MFYLICNRFAIMSPSQQQETVAFVAQRFLVFTSIHSPNLTRSQTIDPIPPSAQIMTMKILMNFSDDIRWVLCNWGNFFVKLFFTKCTVHCEMNRSGTQRTWPGFNSPLLNRERNYNTDILRNKIARITFMRHILIFIFEAPTGRSCFMVLAYIFSVKL